LQNKEKTMTETSCEFVTVRLAGQLLGVPVLLVHDVLRSQQITRVPRAPGFVAGILNLRGRIVTAIDLRARLGLSPREANAPTMNVVVEHKGDPYSFVIDTVGDVLRLEPAQMERNPVTLDQRWRSVSDGIYRLDEELLVVLDIRKLLDFEIALAA
jgi:purine-binding chemotaxis protein CheW